MRTTSALAICVALLLAGHRLVPDIAGVGTLLDSFLPWVGVAIPALAVLALVLRSGIGAASVLVPVLVWTVMFGPAFFQNSPTGTADLRVVTQNLSVDNKQAATTAKELVDSGADVVAVQELTDKAVPVLTAAYPYQLRVGTVGLWSRYRITDSERVDLNIGWTRGVRAEIATPRGQVTVYSVHLGSIRLGSADQRDRTLDALAARVRADPSARLVVLGDLNTASTDRAFSTLVPPLSEAKSGLGFTWPSAFPLTRPDHVLYRGLTAVGSDVLHTTGSDHLAAGASLCLTTRE